ncbi:MAG: hypothetical protein ACXVAY_12920 [Mucilaginibacter sp.]
MKLYKAFAATGATLTWDVMAKIETKVLVTAGLEQGLAQREVTNMINALKESGVTGPTKIPWSGK